jgi:hypothetical protein
MTLDRPWGLRALLAAALLALAAVPARADGGVGVVVTGEATMQPGLVAQLETWLRTHGHDLVSAPMPPDAINALIDCMVIEDKACAGRVIDKRSKAGAIVFANVDVTAGGDALDRTVTLKAHWLAKGKSKTFEEKRVCKRCTDATMRNSADELLVALTAASLGHGILKLTSKPAGARVTLGGKPLGQTPLERGLPAGDHSVTLELEDWQPETRSITVTKGRIDTVEVELTPGPSAPKKTLAYVLLGTGAALALGGGILIALDEDHPDPDGPQPPTYFDSAPLGMLTASIGVAVMGVGAYLLFKEPRRKSAPAVSLVPGGGVIGWAGRF